MDEPGKMHFRRMDEGTDADFAVLAQVHEDNYRSEPLAAFEPMVRRLLDKRWTPPT